jgi:hypothetical protein
MLKVQLIEAIERTIRLEETDQADFPLWISNTHRKENSSSNALYINLHYTCIELALDDEVFLYIMDRMKDFAVSVIDEELRNEDSAIAAFYRVRKAVCDKLYGVLMQVYTQ